ncbi:MAG: GGDEF domain-containing protein [Desulfobulbaceae bacterium]|nr:GGDEF domain-containing protein [Desulfobulbaceae bacterium]HIJ79322.1 GGDEF domain-containing protein [Deltaproteobacteria bacterium]
MNKRIIRMLVYFAIITIMANISPMVDLILHPEIPFFSLPHLLTGSITAAITIILLSLVIRYAYRMTNIANELNRVNKILREQSIRDSLTGLYNHRHFQEMLRHEFLLAKRHQADLTCMMLDLDHFKEVNDECGHPFGDLVLQGTAKQILIETRETDTLARYGGEEFAILLPNTDLAGALIIAERIRHRIEKFIHQNDTYAMRITISIGLATKNSHSPAKPEELLSYADQGLYTAKATGRNKVISYEEK